MPRKKRQPTVADVPVVEPESTDTTVTGGTGETPVRETYEMPGQDVDKLNARTNAFLEREKERAKENDEQSLAVSGEKALVKQGKGGVPATVKQTDPSSGKESQAKEKRSEYYILIGAGMALVALLAGVFIGTSLVPQHQVQTQVVKETTVGPSQTDPLALHNPVQKDSLYGVTFQVAGMEQRDDGLYVTFKVSNDSSRSVYFMINAMKMKTTDGQLFLPEVGQGQIPTTFEAAGLPPGTSDEATVVFAIPKGVTPAEFILDNVTNLQNGSWDFDIPVIVH